MKSTVDAARTLYSQAQDRQNDPKEVWGIPTGFAGLDKLTGGVQREELTVLGADSGVGKSAIAGQMALNIARWVQENRPGEVVRVVHTEMTTEAFLRRLACHQARVKAKRINTGRASGDELKRYAQALREIAELPIEVLDEPQSLEDSVRFLAGRSPDAARTAWWLCDFVQDHPGRERSGAQDGVQQIVDAMKAFGQVAKRIAPGMLTSQLTKAVSERGKDGKTTNEHPHRPDSGDLLGERTILAKANVIMLLYRPDFYKTLEEEQREKTQYAELLVRKNRDGEVGTVKLWFHPAYAEYLDATTFEAEV